MNAQVLIDSTVRQLTILVAQLATSGGIRAPLAQVASQVFVELSRELQNQGVSRKVSADMFGMALRAYIRKVRRLTEGETEKGKTLWQSVFEFLKKEGLVTRRRVLDRFKKDGEVEVSSILKDLCESGLVFCTGNGEASIYRAASDDELGQLSSLADGDGLDELICVLVFRQGPLSMTELAEALSRTEEETQRLVTLLEERGRLQLEVGLITAREFVIPLGSELGWEASVFHHIQAMVQTICQRLQAESRASNLKDVVGGSTYSFDVWPEHPKYQEVRGLLAEQRKRLGDLRTEVESINQEVGRVRNFEEVVVYVGQCCVQREEGKGESNEA